MRETARHLAIFFALGALLLGMRGLLPVPNAPALAAPVDGSEEALLLAEARRLGWYETDAVVVRRLVEVMRFVAADPGADPADLLRQARALGLDTNDTLIRARLLDRMERLLTHVGPADEPSDEALADWLASHAEAYRQPDRIEFSHVFLSRARRDDPDQQAARLRAELTGVPAAAAFALGDPLLGARPSSTATAARAAALWGQELADALAAGPVGAWSEPIDTAAGLHLVRVEARHEGRLPDLDEVRARVRLELLEQRAPDRRAARLEALARAHRGAP